MIEGRSGGTCDVKVQPLRMTAAEVAALDQGWRRLGFKSRTAMLRKAIEQMLDRSGAVDAEARTLGGPYAKRTRSG